MANVQKDVKSDGSTFVQYAPVTGDGAEKPFLPEGQDNNSRLERKDQRLKKIIRYLKFVSRLLSFMMSCAVVGMMVNTVVTFSNTKDMTRDSMSPWPSNPKIWPTFMMLGVSGLGLLSNGAVLIAYFFSHKAANQTSSVASVFSGIQMVAHFIAWAIAAGLFKQQNALKGIENDLWSWSCSPTADARAETFQDVVNYDFLCMSNATSWYLSLASVGMGIITFVLYILAISRVNSKKKARMAQSGVGTTTQCFEPEMR